MALFPKKLQFWWFKSPAGNTAKIATKQPLKAAKKQ